MEEKGINVSEKRIHYALNTSSVLCEVVALRITPD